jgi:hypothetical protein
MRRKERMMPLEVEIQGFDRLGVRQSEQVLQQVEAGGEDSEMAPPPVVQVLVWGAH